jgi:hypothetical protein
MNAMNIRFLSPLAAGLALAASPLATAGVDPIPVRGVASVSDKEIILDVFIDSGLVPLRGFGFLARFDPDRLALTSGGRYDGLWFLRGENGQSYAYTDLTEPDPGRIRVVGGRLDGSDPESGVAGDNLILATLVFRRLDASEPEIEFDFASPEPYVNFATATGESLDPVIKFQKLELQPAPEDSDKDGLPDDYEIATFGDLTSSDGQSDTDADGDSDADEWLRGTDPTDADSRFVLKILPQADGSKLVRWTGRLDRVYDLEWSRDLRGFSDLATGIPGLAPLLDRLDELHNGNPEGFYRVKTRFPTLGR